MLTGKVVGNIVAAKRLWDTPSGALLVIELDSPPAQGKKSPQKGAQSPRERLIALDTLGCGLHEPVLVATGSAVTAWFAEKPPPVDALVIASLA